MAEPIEMLFGLWTGVVTRKHVLDRGWGVHGATWRTRLNCPCVAAMRPFGKITFTTYLVFIDLSGWIFCWMQCRCV